MASITNTTNISTLATNINTKIAFSYALVLVIWSTTPLAIKFGVQDFDATWAYALRMLVATVFAVLLTILVNVKQRKALLFFPRYKSAWLIYIIMGLAMFLGMQLVYIASRYLNSGTVSVLHGLGPMFSAIFSSIMLKKHLSFPRWIALFVAVIGLIIVFYAQLSISRELLLPMLMIVIAVSLHMFAAVCVKKFDLNLNALIMTTGGLIVCSALTLIQFVFTQPSLPLLETLYSINTWGSILYLASFSSIAAYMAYFYILQHLSAVTVGLVTIITPAFALLLGSYFAGEQVSQSFVLGTAVILVSLTWFLHPSSDK